MYGVNPEDVIKTAKDLMRKGRAVTVSTVMRELNFPYSKRNDIYEILENAGFNKRERVFKPYGGGKPFTIYSPKGKFLPFVPRNVDPKAYTRLMERAKNLIEREMEKREFNEKEFYKMIKSSAINTGIKRNIYIVSRFILYDLVEEGFLIRVGKRKYRRKV